MELVFAIYQSLFPSKFNQRTIESLVAQTNQKFRIFFLCDLGLYNVTFKLSLYLNELAHIFKKRIQITLSFRRCGFATFQNSMIKNTLQKNQWVIFVNNNNVCFDPQFVKNFYQHSNKEAQEQQADIYEFNTLLFIKNRKVKQKIIPNFKGPSPKLFGSYNQKVSTKNFFVFLQVDPFVFNKAFSGDLLLKNKILFLKQEQANILFLYQALFYSSLFAHRSFNIGTIFIPEPKCNYRNEMNQWNSVLSFFNQSSHKELYNIAEANYFKFLVCYLLKLVVLTINNPKRQTHLVEILRAKLNSNLAQFQQNKFLQTYTPFFERLQKWDQFLTTIKNETPVTLTYDCT